METEPKKIIPIKQPEEELALPSGEAPAKDAPPTTRYIIKYALILMCVAFVLVLLSYLSHQQQWADIQGEQTHFSVSAMQSIENLQQENARYVEELTQLKLEQDALERENRALREARDQAAEQAQTELEAVQSKLTKAEINAKTEALAAENRKLAMDYLWRIEYLVSARRNAVARTLFLEMQDMGLRAYLSETVMDSVKLPGETAIEEYDRLAGVLDIEID